MRFTSVFIAAGLVATCVAVPSPQPQSPAQTTAAADAIQSYLSALATNPTFLSMASAIATEPNAIESISTWELSIASAFTKGATLPANYLEALPTAAKSLFGSVVTAENSILTKNGFQNTLPTGTSKGAAGSRETGGLMVGLGVAVGLAGVLVGL